VNREALDCLLDQLLSSAQIESSVFLIGAGARGRVVDENPQNAGT
jgi:hypothetical protein